MKAYDNRGLAYAQRGFGPGPRRLQRALDLDPNFALSYYNRGVVNARKGYYEVAIADFTGPWTSTPSWPRPACSVAPAYLKKGDATRAIDDFDLVLQLNPKGQRHTVSGGALI